MTSRPNPRPRALVRVIDDLLWRLRREGFSISTAQAIDAARTFDLLGFERKGDLRAGLAAVVVQSASDRKRFDEVFEAFFGTSESPRTVGSLWQKLAGHGFDPSELEVLRALLEELAAHDARGASSLRILLDRGAELDRLLAWSGVARGIDAHSGMQLGFRTHQLLAEAGSGRARAALEALRSRLARALGARGGELADALARELEGADEEIRSHVRALYQARVEALGAQRAYRPLMAAPFSSLTDQEIEEVRRAVRLFAERLRGGARVRARHARRGRLDAHRTVRLALRTGGVPFTLVRKHRPRERPKLVLLCDVSDSVRAAACFLLELTYAAQELFERARTFVFVSELGETTKLFARLPVRVAIARAWGGGVVPAGDNSNYGRVLRTFEAAHLRELDRRTTVVILGDGRTNYHDAAPEVLSRVRERCRALLWLCPEPRGRWSEGDSAMARYALRCTAVYEVTCAADLERAARALVARG